MRQKSPKHLIRWIGAVICALIALQPINAQPAAIPETEQLLNGLKILFWPKPGSPDVLVKLRIHSGSAFDLSGKAGEMALLGDILFPDPETLEFFTEQMGGKLAVSVNYDSITITMVGKAEQLNNILEVLRNAILSTQLTPEVVAKVREARIKMIKDSSISPAVVADRAITARLFGLFPYGRPSAGTAEELSKVDRADLMLARERFINSNNATLAIVGGVTQTRAMRTLKQLFGPWRRSEEIVPSTFTAPKPPDSRVLILNVPSPTCEVRVALRGVSRSDQQFHTSIVLARIAQYRWQETPALASRPISVRSESYTLPGYFVMGAAVNSADASASVISAKKVLESLITSAPTAAELDRAKRETLADLNSKIPSVEAGPEAWLDADTYRLAAIEDRAALVQAVSATDVQRLANRLFKDAPIATVMVGDSAQLKTALEGKLTFEVMGETQPSPAPAKTPKKPGITTSPS
jgi:predicted Zn-dependent peptidase